MGTTILLLVLALACPQDADRRAFDELVRRLDDETLEARDAAVKALTELPAAADAWLEEASHRAGGETKARLGVIVAERRLRADVVRFGRLGISERLVRERRDLLRAVESKDAAERVAALELASGVKVTDGDELVMTSVPAEVSVSAVELYALVGLALERPCTRHLKMQVIAILRTFPGPEGRPAMGVLLRDESDAIARQAVIALAFFQCDLTPLVRDILQAVVRVTDRGRWGFTTVPLHMIDWNLCLDVVVEMLPKLTEDASSLASTAAWSAGLSAEPLFRGFAASREPSVRRFAALYYGAHSVPDLRDAIERLLEDADADVRASAWDVAAGRLTTDRLLRGAGDADRRVRHAALSELVWGRREPGARDGVRRALEEGDRGVAAWAGRLRGEALEGAARKLASGGPEDREAYASYLGQLGARDGAAELKSLLTDPHESVVDAALWAYLRVRGEESLEELVRLAKAGPAARTEQIVSALCQMPGPRARRALKTFATGATPEVRDEIARWIDRWDADEALEHLLAQPSEQESEYAIERTLRRTLVLRDDKRVLELLKSPNGAVASAAAAALIECDIDGARNAVKEFVKGLNTVAIWDARWSELPRAVPGLAERVRELATEDEPLDDLQAVLGDAKAAARRAREVASSDGEVALDLLGAKDRDAFVSERMAWIAGHGPGARPRKYAQLAGLGAAPAAEALVEGLRTTWRPDRDGIAELVAAIDPALMRPPARKLLSSDRASDRRLGAWILGACGTEDDRARLVPLLSDASVAVRIGALRALKSLGARECAAQIEARLADPRDEVREEAADALSGLKCGSLDRFQALLKDPWQGVRESAIWECARRGDATVAADVVRAIDTDPIEWSFHLWSDAAEALEGLAKAGAKEALDLLRERFGAERAARLALAGAGDAEAIRALRDEGTLDAAALLLERGRLEDPAAWLPKLDLCDRAVAARFLVALNRTVDAKRHEALRGRWTPARAVGARPAGWAEALSALLGVKVRVDASVAPLLRGVVLPASGAYGCTLGCVPVLEDDGITLYSYAAARRVWEKRLRR